MDNDQAKSHSLSCLKSVIYCQETSKYEIEILQLIKRYCWLSLPVFLFFLGGTPRLLRLGLCFFEAPPVCDSFCRF